MIFSSSISKKAAVDDVFSASQRTLVVCDGGRRGVVIDVGCAALAFGLLCCSSCHCCYCHRCYCHYSLSLLVLLLLFCLSLL